MGQITNAIKHTATGVAKARTGLSKGVVPGANVFAGNAVANLDAGSKASPIVREFREAVQGVA